MGQGEDVGGDRGRGSGGNRATTGEGEDLLPAAVRRNGRGIGDGRQRLEGRGGGVEVPRDQCRGVVVEREPVPACLGERLIGGGGGVGLGVHLSLGVDTPPETVVVGVDVEARADRRGAS